MNDDRIFDFTDVKALDALGRADLVWATVPEPWRREHTPTVLHWLTVLQDSYAIDWAERHVRYATEWLARSEGESASALLARMARAEQAFAAFAGQRAERPKIGPMFSPLEATWLVLYDASPALADPETRQAVIDHTTVDGDGWSPLHARWCIDHPERDEYPSPDVDALIVRYLDAEAAILHQTADAAMAPGESAPRPRKRL